MAMMSLMKTSANSCASAKPQNDSQKLIRVDETYLDKCFSVMWRLAEIVEVLHLLCLGAPESQTQERILHHHVKVRSVAPKYASPKPTQDHTEAKVPRRHASYA
eukprot:1825840-Pleurochrysis_carterae.AAC.7